jgi:hypothetical protein
VTKLNAAAPLRETTAFGAGIFNRYLACKGKHEANCHLGNGRAIEARSRSDKNVRASCGRDVDGLFIANTEHNDYPEVGRGLNNASGEILKAAHDTSICSTEIRDQVEFVEMGDGVCYTEAALGKKGMTRSGQCSACDEDVRGGGAEIAHLCLSQRAIGYQLAT